MEEMLLCGWSNYPFIVVLLVVLQIGWTISILYMIIIKKRWHGLVGVEPEDECEDEPVTDAEERASEFLFHEATAFARSLVRVSGQGSECRCCGADYGHHNGCVAERAGAFIIGVETGNAGSRGDNNE